MAYRALGDLEAAEYHLGRAGGAGEGGEGSLGLSDPLMAEVATLLRSPQAHRERAIEADASGDWPEAVRQFQMAVELAPDDAVLRLSLAIAHDRAGNSRAALPDLEAALRLDAELTQAHYVLGTLLERGGRDDEAINRFTVAVAQDPQSAEAQLRLANALRRTGRVEASLVPYRRAQEIDAGVEEARFGEVMGLVRLGRHGEARARLEAALRRTVRLGDAWFPIHTNPRHPLNTATRFRDGVRITTPEEMPYVDMVLCGAVNKRLVRMLGAAGLHAVGVSGSDGPMFTGAPLAGAAAAAEGNHTAAVAQVDTRLPRLLIDHGYLPVIAPTSVQPPARAVNINADAVALRLASALAADRLLFLSDVPGILKDGAVLAALTADEAAAEIAAGTISGGMIPKVEAALHALAQGVRRVVIGQFAAPGDLANLLTGAIGTTMLPHTHDFPDTSAQQPTQEVR